MNIRALFNTHVVWFAIAMLMVPLLLWLSHASTNQLVAAKKDIEHSYNVLFHTEQLRAGLESLETARRAYVLTSQEQYLEPYHFAKRQIPFDIKALAELTADNQVMQENLDAIRPVIGELTEAITNDIRQPARDTALISQRMTDIKTLIDQARALLTDMEVEERRLLETRIKLNEGREREFAYSMLIIAIGFMAVLVFTFMKLFAEVGERKRNQLVLTEAEANNQTTVRNLSLMGELSSLLQACSKTEESLDVVKQYTQRMLNSDSGVLYLFKESRNLLEESAAWGVEAKSHPTFEQDDCWALRRGEIHRLDSDAHTMPCQHLHDQGVTHSLCVPIVAQGAVMGVLHFENHQHRDFTDVEIGLAHNLASQIALALASLRLRETLRNLSVRDPLTGLFNRRYMEESLHREIATAKRKSRQLAVVMLDVDHFKRFNDTFGHDAGDMLLKEVGSLLQSNSRTSDIACRFGGEEFVIIYPETEPHVVLQRTELLREAIAAMQLQHFGRSLGQITASFGLAIFPQDDETLGGLLRKADEALYRAKSEGRNRCVMAA